MQTFRKLPTIVPIANSPSPTTIRIGGVPYMRHPPRECFFHRTTCENSISVLLADAGSGRPEGEDGIGHLGGGAPIGLDDGVGHLAIQGGPDAAERRRRSRRASRPASGRGGRPGPGARLAAGPASAARSAGQPDDEPEVAEHARFGSPKDDAPAGRQDRAGRRAVSSASTRSSSRGTPAPPPRRRSRGSIGRRPARIRHRHQRTAGPVVAPGSGRRSICRSRAGPPAPGPGRSRGSGLHSRSGPSLRFRDVAHHVDRGVLARCRA